MSARRLPTTRNCNFESWHDGAPAGAPGLGEKHQRQEPGHLTVFGHESAEEAGEADRFILVIGSGSADRVHQERLACLTPERSRANIRSGSIRK